MTKLVDRRFEELSRAVRAVQAVGAVEVVKVVLKVSQIGVLDLFARAGYQKTDQCRDTSVRVHSAQVV